MRKTIPLFVSALCLAGLFGCEVSSPRGGGMTPEDGFRVVVPGGLELEQGAVQTFNVSLLRGDQFKQDVKLQISTTKGLSVDPANVTIKASQTPEAQVRLTAAKDAALGDYRVTISGTPGSAGQTTMTDFRVKIIPGAPTR